MRMIPVDYSYSCWWCRWWWWWNEVDVEVVDVEFIVEVINERWRESSTQLTTNTPGRSTPDLDGRWPVVKVGSSHTDSANQKSYSPSPSAGLQRQGFRRPARSVTSARKWLDWSSYGGNATTRIGKNLSSIRYILAWLVGCLYSPIQPTSCHDNNQSCFRSLNL
jgi:hypothetical protein